MLVLEIQEWSQLVQEATQGMLGHMATALNQVVVTLGKQMSQNIDEHPVAPGGAPG